MNFRFAFGAALILSLLPIRSARACSRIAVTSVGNLVTLPLEGGLAPRNTRLWTIAEGEGEFTLVDSRGTSMALARSTIAVGGERVVNLEVLTPMSLLDSGTWTFSRGTTVLSRFTVTDDVDQSAPAALTPMVSGVTGEYFGTSSCGNPSSVRLALGDAAELSIAAPEGATWPVTTALGAANGPVLELAAVEAGEQKLVVFHVDLAGNVTPSQSVSATVPAKASGCSSVSGWPLMLLALALMRRRPSVRNWFPG